MKKNNLNERTFAMPISREKIIVKFYATEINMSTGIEKLSKKYPRIQMKLN